MNDKNIGREIAIFSDAHALYEPTLAALENIKKRGITEIYSLGDNIGVGPNPDKVMDLLTEYNVKSVSGNAEEYIRLGIEPFSSYFNTLKERSQLWTLSKLNEEQIGRINLYPRFFELTLGGEKIALCHFANDVRFDFTRNSTWSYQDKINKKLPGYVQFLDTNSIEQRNRIEKLIKKYGENDPYMQGYVSAYNEPLFNGNLVNFYSAVIGGHVHWKIYESSSSTRFYSIRALGMAYSDDPVDTASYVILREKENGYDLEEVLIEYDRSKMIYDILTSTNPDKTIKKFTNLR